VEGVRSSVGAEETADVERYRAVAQRLYEIARPMRVLSRLRWPASVRDEVGLAYEVRRDVPARHVADQLSAGVTAHLGTDAPAVEVVDLFDIPALVELRRLGLCRSPVHRPPWVNDPGWALTWLTYSTFAAAIDLAAVSDAVGHVLARARRIDIDPGPGPGA
jgi:hypothetical protein